MNCHAGRSVGISHCCIDVYSQCNPAVSCDLIFMDYFSPTSMTLQKSAMLLISTRNVILTDAVRVLLVLISVQCFYCSMLPLASGC